VNRIFRQVYLVPSDFPYKRQDLDKYKIKIVEIYNKKCWRGSYNVKFEVLLNNL